MVKDEEGPPFNDELQRGPPFNDVVQIGPPCDNKVHVKKAFPLMIRYKEGPLYDKV